MSSSLVEAVGRVERECAQLNPCACKIVLYAGGVLLRIAIMFGLAPHAIQKVSAV